MIGAVCAELGGERMEATVAERWWSGLRDHRHEHFAIDAAALAAGESLWRLSLPSICPPLGLPGDQLIEWGGSLRWLRGTASASAVRAAAAAGGGHATLIRAADKSAGAFMPVGEPLMRIHRRLKDSFDPQGIFNPGRLYADL